MLSIEEARDRILRFFSRLDSESKHLLDSIGQVLANGITAPSDIPPLDNSAMDGYAVQFSSICGASSRHPKELQVVGEIAAGQLPKHSVTSGNTIRIMTGAPVPNGADTIVPFEDTDEVDRKVSDMPVDRIRIRTEVPKGAYIRAAGEDIQSGTVILKQGNILGSGEVGVLASIGLSRVNVFRRPVIAILATGDELQEPGQNLEPGQIYDSNSFSLASAIKRYGGIPHMLGIAHDNLDSIQAKLDQVLDDDMLLTSAGVSKGDYDIVKDVLAKHGKLDFWSIRMKPAKPLAFGTIRLANKRRIPHIGLPGNPVSALVAFEQLVRPAILKMLGQTNLKLPTITATLQDTITNDDGRRVYARVIVTEKNGEYIAKLTGHQGSNILTSMVQANGLAICPEDVQRVTAGSQVSVELLNWPN
jgi:molybdopterin molybdotransferase